MSFFTKGDGTVPLHRALANMVLGSVKGLKNKNKKLNKENKGTLFGQK